MLDGSYLPLYEIHINICILATDQKVGWRRQANVYNTCRSYTRRRDQLGFFGVFSSSSRPWVLFFFLHSFPPILVYSLLLSSCLLADSISIHRSVLCIDIILLYDTSFISILRSQSLSWLAGITKYTSTFCPSVRLYCLVSSPLRFPKTSPLLHFFPSLHLREYIDHPCHGWLARDDKERTIARVHVRSSTYVW